MCSYSYDAMPECRLDQALRFVTPMGVLGGLVGFEISGMPHAMHCTESQHICHTFTWPAIFVLCVSGLRKRRTVERSAEGVKDENAIARLPVCCDLRKDVRSGRETPRNIFVRPSEPCNMTLHNRFPRPIAISHQVPREFFRDLLPQHSHKT